MTDTYFVTGIGTDVGKTIVAAIVTEALEADYWKPVQAGDLGRSDSHKVKQLISNKKSSCHPPAFELRTAASPHAAAAIDGVAIQAQEIQRPTTRNTLVIEGAGGLLVPVNERETIADLIFPDDKVIIVSRHYLGSINHTLLTIEALEQRGLTPFGIIFSGMETPATEQVIKEMTGIRVLGRIEEEPYFDKRVVLEYAGIFKNEWMK